MKRLRSVCYIVLLVILAQVTTAYADSFTVRNGIKFGISEEEVIRTENSNGNQPDVSDASDSSELSYSNISVAGVPNSKITYSFSSGALDGIEYTLFNIPLKDTVLYSFDDTYRYYSQIESSLSEQYGDSGFGSSDHSLCAFTPSELIDNIRWDDYIVSGYDSDGQFAGRESFRSSDGYFEYTQRLVEFDDTFVLITHTAYGTTSIILLHNTIYTPVQRSLVEAAKDAYIAAQKETQDQLDNDL